MWKEQLLQLSTFQALSKNLGAGVRGLCPPAVYSRGAKRSNRDSNVIKTSKVLEIKERRRYFELRGGGGHHLESQSTILAKLSAHANLGADATFRNHNFPNTLEDGVGGSVLMGSESLNTAS